MSIPSKTTGLACHGRPAPNGDRVSTLAGAARRDGLLVSQSLWNKTANTLLAPKGRRNVATGGATQPFASRDLRSARGDNPSPRRGSTVNRQSTIDNRQSLRRFVAPSLRRSPFDFSTFRRFDFSRPAFSLIEMMIAIVILGLGLVMVATIFPVGWTRARTLSETTVQRSIAAGAHTRLQARLVAAGSAPAPELDVNANPSQNTCGPVTDRAQRLNGGAFAGDLFFDPQVAANPNAPPIDAVLYLGDTRVHALNSENALASDPTKFVVEDPWRVELFNADFVTNTNLPDPEWPRQLGCGFWENSFMSPQLDFESRFYPPLPNYPAAGTLGEQAQWQDQLDQRRHALAVLHRMPKPAVVIQGTTKTNNQVAEEAATAAERPRVFDVYYVTLRRPNPTNKYAQQDFNVTPDWVNRGTVAAPTARPATDDVVVPVAWRVQVEYQAAGVFTKAVAVGAPTEVLVPPTGLSASNQAKALSVGMFPEGTRFIDEENGRVLRVVKRRITGLNGEAAVITLDREVYVDELDDDREFGGNQLLEQEERIRTVWVFPPAVDRADPTNPVFSGPSPVVSIDVRTLTLAPAS